MAETSTQYIEFKTRADIISWVNLYYPQEYITKIKECYQRNNGLEILRKYKDCMYIVYNELLRNPEITFKQLFYRIRKKSNPKELKWFENRRDYISDFRTLKKEIDLLDCWLQSITIPTNIIVYRYVCEKEHNFLTMNKNDQKTVNQFLSTTLFTDKDCKHPYRNKKIIRILLPKGTYGTYLPEARESAPEREILLPHHMKLKYIEHQNNDDKIPTFLCSNKEIKEQDLFQMFEQ